MGRDRSQRFFRAGVLLCVGPMASIAGAVTYDLKDDWSDVQNPNGVWAYRQGTTLLPHVEDWLGQGQPAWAHQAPYGPGHIPTWQKRIDDAPAANDADWRTGDVLVHSFDYGNGLELDGGYEANLQWTSPGGGIIEISLGLWRAAYSNRGNNWELYHNSELIGAGDADGTREDPVTFGINRSVGAGDTLTLFVLRDPGISDGNVTGVNLTIESTVPEPGGALAALAWVGAMSSGRVGRRRTARE